MNNNRGKSMTVPRLTYESQLRSLNEQSKLRAQIAVGAKMLWISEQKAGRGNDK